MCKVLLYICIILMFKFRLNTSGNTSDKSNPVQRLRTGNFRVFTGSAIELAGSAPRITAVKAHRKLLGFEKIHFILNIRLWIFSREVANTAASLFFCMDTNFIQLHFQTIKY